MNIDIRRRAAIVVYFHLMIPAILYYRFIAIIATTAMSAA